VRYDRRCNSRSGGILNWRWTAQAGSRRRGHLRRLLEVKNGLFLFRVTAAVQNIAIMSLSFFPERILDCVVAHEPPTLILLLPDATGMISFSDKVCVSLLEKRSQSGG